MDACLKSLQNVSVSPKKVFHTVFFNVKEIVLQKPCTLEATVSSNYYRDFVVAAVNSFHKKAIPNIGMRSN